MNNVLLLLTDTDLRELARALAGGRLLPPYSGMAVEPLVTHRHAAPAVAGELQKLHEVGFTSQQLATTVDLLVQARTQRTVPEDIVDLVTTGPEAPGICNRDTGVVVRELFTHAQQSVLVAGYAVYQGQQVFQALAERMQECPALRVRFVLDIQRPVGDTSADSEVIRRFADRFRTREWPEKRLLPEVFYDPRSLRVDPQKRACMHAKCIVIDRKSVFVSSANFTEAAQERNVEVGLLIRLPAIGERLHAHFDSLIAQKLLAPVN